MQHTRADACRIVSALVRDTLHMMRLITEILDSGGNMAVQHLKDTADHNLRLIAAFEAECGHRMQDNFTDIAMSRRLLAEKK